MGPQVPLEGFEPFAVFEANMYSGVNDFLMAMAGFNSTFAG